MLQPYSGRAHEFIQSISRPGLNALLLDEASRHPAIRILFHHHVNESDVYTARVRGKNLKTDASFDIQGDILIGTDGAGSDIRQGFMQVASGLRFNFSQSFLDHGYKELEIPAGPNGEWQIEKNALHIWPRQQFMVIALPNLNGSFTVTLFLAFDGNPGFDQLNKPDEIQTFFKTQFPDLVELMPDLVHDFQTHPTGILGTIKCSPWHTQSSILMGDAAHAVVPFYGQGMNCAMEDVRILDELLDQHAEDWKATMLAYQKTRKKDTDAIADLAVENYYEMRDHVDNPNFIAKRKIEMMLEKQFPEYASKYNLVTFCENTPYSEAFRKGHAQDAWLLDYCDRHDTSQLSTEELQRIAAQLRSL